MKKMRTRLAALAMAVVLLSCLCLSVGAEGYYLTPSDKLAGMDLAGACPPHDGGAAETVPMGEGAPVGIFALKLRNGSQVASMGAFLVKSGNSTYILTHAIASTYESNGYELTLMGMDGENHQATCVAVLPDYELCYLYANGMEDYEPLNYSRDAFANSVTVALSYPNSNYTAAKYIEYRSYDFSRFTQLTDLYYAEMKREVSLQWLGSPVLPSKTSLDVQGICSSVSDEDDISYMALITFEDLKLEPSFSLAMIPGLGENEPAVTEGEEEETDPTSTTHRGNDRDRDDDEDEDENKWGIPALVAVVLAAAAGGVYYYYKKVNAEKAENQRKLEEDDPFSLNNMGSTSPVMPVDYKNPTKPVSKWVVKSINGPMLGQSFSIDGTTLVGRSNIAQIRFPENTSGISSSHCELVPFEDYVMLRDLNSSYGTFTSAGKVQPGIDCKLVPGDTFTLANICTFRLEKPGQPSWDKPVSVPAAPAPAAVDSRKKLSVRASNGKVYRSAASDKLTFGRSSSNSVVVTGGNNAVSGNHCVLYREGGKLYLKDLGSTNGTFFNQTERLKPNTPYHVTKGKTFYLASPVNTFTITEE